MNEQVKSIFSSDFQFDSLLDSGQRKLTNNQFSPLKVIEEASAFLCRPGIKVLDIGSGIGKFCLYAAYLYPETEFYGIEQRCDFHRSAEKLLNQLGLKNVHFKGGNMISESFADYQSFYFYNSFHENLAYGSEAALEADAELELDADFNESSDRAADIYLSYSEFMMNELKRTSAGSRLVTFHSQGIEVPHEFSLVKTSADGKMCFWIK